MNHYHAVIMAGGVGSRFWPVSTQSFPKQFHDMLGTGKSLLQTTFGRLQSFIPKEQIQILTNQRYAQLCLEQLPQIGRDQLVLEPAMRNTAPCLLLSALKIYKQDPEALILVAPSDHWIEDVQSFKEDVIRCFDYCQQHDALATLGIKPSFPNTGYGYIEAGQGSGPLNPVNRFCEKPDYTTAQEFLAAGNFYWNAGIFVWSARSIIGAFQQYMPQMYDLFTEGVEVYNTDKETAFLAQQYPKAENISIDYAILEQSDKVWMQMAHFDWNDLGAWGALYDKLPKDGDNNAVVRAKTLVREANGNMVYTATDKLVVIDQLNDYIVVDKEKVLLIVPKEKEQDIKQILQQVVQKYGSEYQ